MTKKFFAITAGGTDMGVWEAKTPEEALGMLSRDAGYASLEEADRVVFEATGRYPERRIEEISAEEAEQIDEMTAEEGISQSEARKLFAEDAIYQEDLNRRKTEGWKEYDGK